MIPPEVSQLFKDWPFGILIVVLASPFVALASAIVVVIVQRIKDRGSQQVAVQNADTAEKGVQVSEKEAETHAFQAIVDGFKESFTIVSKRAEDAEKTAKEAKEETASLSGRVKVIEDERHDAIRHIFVLEALIPYPPGPPPRPIWMQPQAIQEMKQIK